MTSVLACEDLSRITEVYIFQHTIYKNGYLLPSPWELVHYCVIIILVYLFDAQCVYSYDDVLDEGRATNLMISADESFFDITISTLGVRNMLLMNIFLVYLSNTST